MSQYLPALAAGVLPAHVAIIMDGNGRWAQERGRPRAFGHRVGVRAARRAVQAAAQGGVKVLTMFAFSQENWNRPETEVQLLMQLFVKVLRREIASLKRNNIRLRFIGDHSQFPPVLGSAMVEAERFTGGNTGLKLVIAVGYGGQWDIARAASRLAEQGRPITPEALESQLDTAGLPRPDLLIRTGGERRISNFLLWQLAYAELYFCDTLWPDFDEAEFNRALSWYATRQRRFGRVPDVV